MKELKLLKHGERVRIEYQAPSGSAEGAMGASTEEERPGGKVSGIVKRYRKDRTAEGFPQALGWIKATYKDAVKYTGMTKELRGYGFFLAVFFGGVGFAVSVIAAIDFFTTNDWFLALLDAVFGPVALVFALWITTFGLRIDLFKPTDLPIIFDRKHGKVYRILREEQPGWRGLFKPWPVLACEYDWELVDAEHEAEVLSTGATVVRNHFLMFIVRKSASDPTIIDSFQIANASSLSEHLVPAVWEHIRRFMEEGGPHLPSLTEPLANMEAPLDWWHSVGATGPFGPGYMKRWNEQPGYMWFMHLALPVTLPMFLLWGTGNWLSYKTAITVDWPQEVKRAVGPSMKSEPV
ncbi:DUF6708 domain-containing protein [Variovorax sp. W2I14]|uniref:DUF6708 domain-containing protein n=1 Tax=Variovorax sp. W2I14 TaxID=3042290 RepID=UPI003D1FBBAC